MKQRRTIASIDDHTDGNNRPNKRNRSIDRSADDDDDDKGDEDENSDNDDDDEEENVIGTECLSTTICKTLRRCSRCTEANRMMMLFPTAVDWMKARQGKYTHYLLVMREPLRKRGVEWW